MGAIPYVPDGAGASFRGQKGQQEPFAAAFVVLPYPSPGRGITASRWRFGMVSRCSAYGATRPAENLGPGGGQVRRSCTPAMVDVQPCAKAPGGHKIEPRSAEYPIRGCAYSPPRKPSEIPASGGFRFVGPRIQFRDYVAIYSIAKSVIQPNGSFLSVLNGASPRERRTTQRMGRLAHSVADKAST